MMMRFPLLSSCDPALKDSEDSKARASAAMRFDSCVDTQNACDCRLSRPTCAIGTQLLIFLANACLLCSRVRVV